MAQTDSIGRATFDWIAPRSDVVPTTRDQRWMTHIERHGPLSSEDLIASTSDTHRCKDSGLRRLQALRAAGLLRLPEQQRTCVRAEFRPYVYDLSVQGRSYLVDLGLAEPTIRPTGHWWHIFETARFTARVELDARSKGYRYIAAHELPGNLASLAMLIGRQRLIPDQLFAIDYGGLFRAFLVEVDRGTEPIASASARKSWVSALSLYERAFASDLPNRHYGLKAPIHLIWILSTPARCGAFERLLATQAGDFRRRVIVGVTEAPTPTRVLAV